MDWTHLSQGHCLFLTTTAFVLMILGTLSVSQHQSQLLHVTDSDIVLCPRGSTQKSTQPLDTFHAHSLIDCAVRCLRRGDCGSFNYCPEGVWEEEEEEEEVTCQILTNQQVPSCQTLHPAESELCQHGFDGFDADVCQNGGTYNGFDCQCLPQYAGDFCERYIHDCSEIYTKGYTNENYTGTYLIHPLNSTQPFLVYCTLTPSYAITWVYKRSAYDLSLTWDHAKRGYPGDLTLTSHPEDFFIGLDNLHDLTAQTHYQAYMKYRGENDHRRQDRYVGFQVGSEMEAYQVTYSMSVVQAHNNQTLLWPILFCTPDRDACGCASQEGVAGWYGAECKSFRLFNQTDKLFWVNNTRTPIAKTMLYLVKIP